MSPVGRMLFVGVVTLAAVSAMAQRDQGDGVVYEGQLVEGVRSGRGVLTWGNGYRYEGEFNNGVRDGRGTLQLPTGDVYDGDFQNDAMTGQGRLVWVNGDIYDGDFVDGKRTGRGSYTWRSGARYVGELEAGIPHGEGVYEYTDGTVYRGRFENGLKQGLGELLQDGTRHYGWFVDDLRHGVGHYRWQDGTLYRGHFAFDRQHGPGVKQSPGGELSFQDWEAGELVAAANVVPVARCALTIADTSWMFDGDECINGVAHGRGTAVRLDGLAYILDGRFVIGKLVSGEPLSLALDDAPRRVDAGSRPRASTVAR